MVLRFRFEVPDEQADGAEASRARGEDRPLEVDGAQPCASTRGEPDPADEVVRGHSSTGIAASTATSRSRFGRLCAEALVEDAGNAAC